MVNPIKAWNDFFFRPISAKPLGLIRILFGMIALYNLALCSVEIDYWYSGNGLLPGNEAWSVAGALQLSILHYYQDPITVRALFAATAVAAFGLMIGWRSRLMSILFYIGMVMINNRNLVTSSGADVLLLVYAFNIMLCPSGAAYSVDAWLESRKRNAPADPLIIPWGFRLIQIQLCLVYTLALVLKLGGNLWLDGSALHYVLNNTEVIRFDFSFLSDYPVLINLMTYASLVIEFALAFLIWFRAVRPIVIFSGLLLHGGIMLAINIPIFGELMWLGYIAFLTPPEFDAFLHAIDVRRLFRRPAQVEQESAEIVVQPTPAANPFPAFGSASVMVRLDGGGGLLSPHRMDKGPSRNDDDRL